jgi:hypothetical protein
MWKSMPACRIALADAAANTLLSAKTKALNPVDTR